MQWISIHFVYASTVTKNVDSARALTIWAIFPILSYCLYQHILGALLYSQKLYSRKATSGKLKLSILSRIPIFSKGSFY